MALTAAQAALYIVLILPYVYRGARYAERAYTVYHGVCGAGRALYACTRGVFRCCGWVVDMFPARSRTPESFAEERFSLIGEDDEDVFEDVDIA